MIVVDTSVWIAKFRRVRTAEVIRFEALVDDYEIVVGDAILLEILQGARDNAHAAELERQLRRFRIEAMLNERRATEGARHYRELRARGVTVRKTIVIIATFCIAKGYSLLHQDRDFEPMQRYLGLAVV